MAIQIQAAAVPFGHRLPTVAATQQPGRFRHLRGGGGRRRGDTQAVRHCAPMVVVSMARANQRVRDLVQQGYAYFGFIIEAHKVLAEGDFALLVVTTAAALPRMVQAKPPIVQTMFIQQFAGKGAGFLCLQKSLSPPGGIPAARRHPQSVQR